MPAEVSMDACEYVDHFDHLEEHAKDPYNVPLFPDNADPKLICDQLPHVLAKLDYEYDSFYIGATGRSISERSRDITHTKANGHLHLLSTFHNQGGCAEAEEFCIAHLNLVGKTKKNTCRRSVSLKTLSKEWKLYVRLDGDQSTHTTPREVMSKCISDADVHKLFHVRIEKSVRGDSSAKVDKRFFPLNPHEKHIFQTHSKYNHPYARSVAELKRMLPSLLTFRTEHPELCDSDSDLSEDDSVDSECNDDHGWSLIGLLKSILRI